MSKHTPGPWSVSESGSIEYADGYLGEAYDFNGTTKTDLPMMANARLMAAAPEMLEFIRKVMTWELVDCDIHEYVMSDDEVREEALKLMLRIFPDYYQTTK